MNRTMTMDSETWGTVCLLDRYDTEIITVMDIGDSSHDVVTKPESNITLLKGPVADRLREYEDLGYTPEELKKIICERGEYKLRCNAIYGKNAFKTKKQPEYGVREIVNEAMEHGDRAVHISVLGQKVDIIITPWSEEEKK